MSEPKARATKTAKSTPTDPREPAEAKVTRTKAAKAVKAVKPVKAEKAEKAAPGPRPRLPKTIQVVLDAALGRKAMDVVVMDLRKSDAFTDFFVIATGGNTRQVQAIADSVEAALKELKIRPSHVEGYKHSEWVLVDYFDFVVHVFSPSARTFYGLDRLWGDAKRFEIADH